MDEWPHCEGRADKKLKNLIEASYNEVKNSGTIFIEGKKRIRYNGHYGFTSREDKIIFTIYWGELGVNLAALL